MDIAFSSVYSMVMFKNSTAVLRGGRFSGLQPMPNYAAVAFLSCSFGSVTNVSFSRLPGAEDGLPASELVAIHNSTVEIFDCVLPPSAFSALFSEESRLMVKNTKFLGGTCEWSCSVLHLDVLSPLLAREFAVSHDFSCSSRRLTVWRKHSSYCRELSR